MEWWTLLLALVGLVVFLLAALRRAEPDADPPTSKGAPPAYRQCPLCGHWLRPGETVHSTMFQKGKDSLMDIWGCPYCRPDSSRKDGSVRLCPVCRRALDPDESVPARVFRRPDKMHIHVLGCKVCRRVAY